MGKTAVKKGSNVNELSDKLKTDIILSPLVFRGYRKLLLMHI